jgi:hypothetical protein
MLRMKMVDMVIVSPSEWEQYQTLKAMCEDSLMSFLVADQDRNTLLEMEKAAKEGTLVGQPPDQS